VVRQAHLPGNYELYDLSSNKLGLVVCKICWERHGKQTTSPMSTVCVSVEGYRMVWWLCQNHADELKAKGEVKLLKSTQGAIPSPQI
jgi:hypothetical protein